MTDEKLEFKIGKIEGELPQKFIIAKVDEALVYFAGSYMGMVMPHFVIAKKHHLIDDQVLGGGLVDRGLRIYDESMDFGAVPLKVIEKFKDQLLDIYKVKTITFSPKEQAVRYEKWYSILEKMEMQEKKIK